MSPTLMTRVLPIFGAITAAIILTVTVIKGQLQVAPEQNQSAAGIALPDGYRAATFSCW